MSRLANILLIVTLAVLAWQDFRSRQIAWWLLPVLFFGFLLAGKEQFSWLMLGKNMLFNLSFLFLQFLLVWFWMILRQRKIFNPVDRQVGLGDILFLICLTAGFSPVNFFFFYTTVLLFVLLIAALVKIRSAANEMLIPLAGAIAVPLLLLCLFRLVHPAFDFYNEDWLSGWLNANV